MTLASHDRIYQDASRDESRFVFDDAVAEVFADMINRSVPGYSTILGMLGVIAEKYIQHNSKVYDLGCSQGAATIAVGNHILKENIELVSVDNSAAMINKCRENLASAKLNVPTTVLCEDIAKTKIKNASLVILNLTLQFVPQAERSQLLKKIKRGMLPGSALVLTEKTTSANQEEQAFLTSLHHEFKRANGYSELEISRKRNALEEVLIPESDAEHLQRLEQTGFSHSYRWFSCLGFNAYIAIV